MCRIIAARRPFLTARWANLILATYAVDPDVLTPLLPPGCRLDLAGGRALVSLVAFDFLETRVLGVRWPGFVNFPEVNLRFYVRHGRAVEADTEQRGVVFVREFVPQRSVAALARWAYNEPYRAVPMSSQVSDDGEVVTVQHDLRVAGGRRHIGVVADSARVRPTSDSPEAFLIEHQWGFGTSRRGKLIRYQVAHEAWDVHPVRSFDLNWDWAAAYGARFAFLQGAEPASVVLAAGSAVSVYPQGWLNPMIAERPAVTAPTSLVPENVR